MAGLVAVPVTLDEANAFVRDHHRHHKPVIGHKFSIGAAAAGRMVGVAIVGRPVARSRDDGRTLEVTRLCTDGTRNVCSFLYLWSDPVVNNGNNIWGLPVVDTTAVAPGKFLCGAFNIAAQIFDREDAAVEVSSEDADNFRRNLVTILVEERLALAVTRPESFVYGNLVDGDEA